MATNQKSLAKISWEGFWENNPVLVQLLGMCPALAVTTSAENGLGMGLATTFVLVCSSFIISLMRKILNPQTRIVVFAVTIASFVTLVDLFMQAKVPALSKSLGAFVPLIVVNCIIISRQEMFASKNNPFRSVIDALANGAGIIFAFTLLGAIREVFGTGKLFNFKILFDAFYDKHEWVVALLPAGAFISLGLLIALINVITKKDS